MFPWHHTVTSILPIVEHVFTGTRAVLLLKAVFPNHIGSVSHTAAADFSTDMRQLLCDFNFGTEAALLKCDSSNCTLRITRFYPDRIDILESWSLFLILIQN